MDKELKEIAQRIYLKHKKALDLIFEVASNTITQFSDHIKIWLESNKNLFEVNFDPEYSRNTLIRFTTKFIDEMFPYDDTKSDNWGFGYSFLYEIVIRKDSIHAVGVLANFTRDNSQMFMDFKPSKNATKWQRILSKKILLEEEDITEGLTEETITKLDSKLKELLTKHIPKFEKSIKESK